MNQDEMLNNVKPRFSNDLFGNYRGEGCRGSWEFIPGLAELWRHPSAPSPL
jgi:hypothetical protein